MQTVLVPPLLTSARIYDPLLDVFWAHGAATVADTRRDDSIAGMAARLLAATVGEFVLLGTSMGGYVALEVMRQAPERVAALVLVSTSAREDTPEQRDSREQQSRIVQAGGFDRLVDAAFPGVVAAQHEDDPALLDAWRTSARAVGPEAFLRQQRAVIERADSRGLLAGIAVPTLVVHGADDRLIPRERGEELAAAIPGAELAIVPDAGHFTFWEARDATTAPLAAFLDRVDDGR